MKDSNSIFFSEKTIEFAEKLYEAGNKKLLILLKNQQENRDAILEEIAKILLKYRIKDNFMDLTTLEQEQIFYKISKQIDNNLNNEIETEDKEINKTLKDTAKDKYYSNSYLLSLGVTETYITTELSDEDLKAIINRRDKNKTYSERTYKNKNDMAKMLKSDIRKLLTGQTSINDIERTIRNRYNSNAYNTKRLVTTEIARVMEETNNIWQEQHNIKYVMYCATLDNHTCNDCGEYDGQIFNIDEKPITLPAHPLCRCTYIAVPDENYKPKMRLNNETKQNINWKTYLEWRSQHV